MPLSRRSCAVAFIEIMVHQQKIDWMVDNYIRKRNVTGKPVMEFHREHLLLFLNRFFQFIAGFSTPSSSLLSHEIFLVVEAATIVAKSDWAKCDETDKEKYRCFQEYFAAFDTL